MKKIFYLSTLLILLFSCQPKAPEQAYFTVSGKFQNTSKGEIITLYHKNPDELITIDSAEFSSKGEFELKGLSTKKHFYILRSSANYDIVLLIDSTDQITITADNKNLINTYEVTGSKESFLIQNLEQQISRTRYVIDSLGGIYRKYYQSSEIDSIKPRLDKKFFETYNNQKQFSVNFIKKYSNSLVSLIALSQYISEKKPVFDTQKDAHYYFMVDSVLSKKYPNSADVKKMNQFCITLKKNIKNNTPPSGNLVVGMNAPEILDIKNLMNQSINLSTLNGKYVIVSFWASWSSISIKENYNLNKWYWKYYHKFDVVNVSLDQNEQSWQNSIKRHKFHWFHVCHFNEWDSEPVKDYNVTELPANFIIDPSGKIIRIDVFGDDLHQALFEIFGV